MARQEIRVLRSDPTPMMVLVVMPLVLMAFLKPAFRSTIVATGHPDASGAEQAVPGMAVLFAFFLVGFVGFMFFRDHGWGTWERLRASRARPIEIVLGKVAPGFVLAVFQLTVLFVAGTALFGLKIRGSLFGLLAVGAALSACLVALAVAVVAVSRTVQQLYAFSNLGAMVFGAVGGAIVPFIVLPGWARAIAPVTPTYWAMRGFRSVLLDGTGISAMALPVGVLCAMAGGFGALAVVRLSFEETKASWA